MIFSFIVKCVKVQQNSFFLSYLHFFEPYVDVKFNLTLFGWYNFCSCS